MKPSACTALVESWRKATPYGKAVFRRFAELMDYGYGRTDRDPHPDWKDSDIAHLEGAPETKSECSQSNCVTGEKTTREAH